MTLESGMYPKCTITSRGSGDYAVGLSPGVLSHLRGGTERYRLMEVDR